MKNPHWILVVIYLFGLWNFAYVDGTEEEMDYYEYDNFIVPNEILLSETEFKKVWGKGKDNVSDMFNDEWEKWLEEERTKWNARGGNISRLFPYCVDGEIGLGLKPKNTDIKKNFVDPNLESFYDILQTYSGPIGSYVIHTNVNNIIPKPEGKHDDYSNSKWIDKIEFKSIYSPPAPVPIPAGSGPRTEDADKILGIGRLNQWMHIIVTMKVNITLEGLYIQANAGPLGLPFGEFRTDFDCTVNGLEDDPVSKYTEVTENPRYAEGKGKGAKPPKSFGPKVPILSVPCKYRSKAMSRYPSVYVYGGNVGAYQKPRSKFRMHFNWDETRCGEASHIQFLIIAVEKFQFPNTPRTNYEILVTPSYVHNPDSLDGMAYPYSHDWDSKPLVCKDDLTQIVPNVGDGKPLMELRPKISQQDVVYNFDYDQCIQYDQKFDITDSSCPPNSMQCDADASKVAANRVDRLGKITKDGCILHHCPDPDKAQLVLNRTTAKDRLLTNAVEDLMENYLTLALQKKKDSRANHVKYMIGSFLVVVSISHFWARYFKETEGTNPTGSNTILGLGVWLFGHILMFFVTTTMAWIGIFEVAAVWGKTYAVDCELYEETMEGNTAANIMHYTPMLEFCENNYLFLAGHVGLGMVAFVMYHVSFAVGWLRPHNITRRLFIYLHVGFGYGCQVMAVASVFVFVGSENVCLDIVVETGVFLVITLIMTVLGTVVQKMEDVNMKTTRRQFPIVTAIEFPQKQFHTFVLIKYLLQLMNIVLYSALLIWVCIGYDKLLGDLTDEPEPPKDDTPFGPRFAMYNSLMGTCKEALPSKNATEYCDLFDQDDLICKK